MPSQWNGDKLLERVRRAAVEAINETTEAAATDAAADHWWLARKGEDGLEGQIITEPASLHGDTASGRFGTTQRSSGFFGLFLEYKRPFIRPAADRNFPDVIKRMREKLR